MGNSGDAGSEIGDGTQVPGRNPGDAGTQIGGGAALPRGGGRTNHISVRISYSTFWSRKSVSKQHDLDDEKESYDWLAADRQQNENSL